MQHRLSLDSLRPIADQICGGPESSRATRREHSCLRPSRSRPKIMPIRSRRHSTEDGFKASPKLIREPARAFFRLPRHRKSFSRQRPPTTIRVLVWRRSVVAGPDSLERSTGHHAHWANTGRHARIISSREAVRDDLIPDGSYSPYAYSARAFQQEGPWSVWVKEA